MQENEFEKAIREKLNSWQLAPSKGVWEKVASEIGENKRKRRFLFLLYFSVTVAVLGGGYLYVTSNSPSAPAAGKQIYVEDYDSSATSKIRVANNKNNNVVNGFNKPGVQSDKSVETTHTGRIERASETGTSPRTIFYQQKPSTNDNAIKKATPSYTKGRQTFALELTKPPLVKSSSVDEIPLLKVQRSQNVNANSNEKLSNNEKQVQLKDASNDTASQNKMVQTGDAKMEVTDSIKQMPAMQKSKKMVGTRWHIGFTVLAGISGNGSHFPFLSNAATPLASQPNQSSNGAGIPPISSLHYASGLSYGVGVYLQNSLSKKMAITIGVGYHYFSAASQVGSRNNNAQSFYDPNLQFAVTVDRSFSSGQTSKYINRYHLIEMPMNVLWQLNANVSKPISITAGLSPAYLIKSNALYANNTQNVYYASEDQFKKLQVAAQAGLQIGIVNNRLIRTSVGPHLQYGLNNMAKAVNNTNQHLISASIKLNVGLK